MGRKSKSRCLLEKSIEAAISAIEIYNKPDFKYREESFSILMVNAWEVLLKAKIIDDNKGNLKSVFEVDKNAKRRDGKPYKSAKFKKNKAGNERTISISSCLGKLQLDEVLKENIKLLVEIRNNAIHFYNKSKHLERKVLEIGTATLKSYVHCVKEWFQYDLSKYNFYLMPISFFHLSEFESFSVKDTRHQNLLNYIEKMEKENPSDENKDHNISLIQEVRFVRSKSEDAVKVKFDSSAKASIKVDSEDQFKNKYPWEYKTLISKLKVRYSDFKQDRKFYDLKNKIEQRDEEFCGVRYLDPHKKTGTQKKFYSPNILKEFDKHYKKKDR